ncbi:uncharacterized protein N7515_003895 [Penicillium bovifimosum]|uniref:Uncharacterized protein n=1 Tax=Penicillium bovifimosum TaxID=126998 RepID=A0A9W9L6N5_9EURO|nr:uncharacterized protein N7515_003895 [Penicillium bovifimosum]KAJ5139047.1 hypothetical protein N7515_003895 [Penicillium bovifimosum]
MIQSRCAVDSLEKRKRHRIFGLCTDGEDFHCLEIDSGLNWSRLHLTYSNDLQQILEMLAFIHFCVSCRLPAEKLFHTSDPLVGLEKSIPNRKTVARRLRRKLRHSASSTGTIGMTADLLDADADERAVRP